MKQKYSISKDTDNQQIIINEYAELDKEIMSLLCSQTYDFETIGAAIKKGKDTLFQTIRNVNFYPPYFYTNAIAETIIGLMDSEDNGPRELFFDDVDLLSTEQAELDDMDSIEDEPDTIDELLDDDIEESFDDDETLGNINSPLKIADDESLDIEDDI